MDGPAGQVFYNTSGRLRITRNLAPPQRKRGAAEAELDRPAAILPTPSSNSNKEAGGATCMRLLRRCAFQFSPELLRRRRVLRQAAGRNPRLGRAYRNHVA